MPSSLTELAFLGAALTCLLGSAVLEALWPRRRAITCGATTLSVALGIAGLAVTALRRSAWPLATPAEWVLASAVSAVAWYQIRQVMGTCGRTTWPATLALCAMVAGLLAWGNMRLPPLQTTSAITSVSSSITNSLQQPWLFATRLALVLACGAFIEAGSIAWAELWSDRHQGPAVIESKNRGYKSILTGTGLLTMALLLQALEGMYHRGAFWSWSSAESWQLFLWLYYTMLWCAIVIQGWSARRVRPWTACGLILTFMLLRGLGA